MEHGDQLDVALDGTTLGFFDRLEMAKAHCALVFESRGGKLTDAEVVDIARRWTTTGRDREQLDVDMLIGRLFSWLG
jgi:hypothetical protein